MNKCIFNDVFSKKWSRIQYLTKRVVGSDHVFNWFVLQTTETKVSKGWRSKCQLPNLSLYGGQFTYIYQLCL